MAALAFSATALVFGSVTVHANEVSELCRTSAHQTNGPDSAAPDICAAIETGAHDRKPRVLDADRTVEELAAAAEKADFVLLGEIHDNPSHHRIRGQIILALAAQRAKAKRPTPGLVLEHIRADQALAVAGFRAVDRVQRRSVDDLFAALDWKKSGWPPEALFRPMIEAALDVEWPIIHGNLTREGIRAVAKGGIGALDAEETKSLGLDTPLPDGEQNGLLDELVGSHCGIMPRAALTTMADAQRYRDAYMANQLVDAAKTHQGAVLLAGNGHVRRDRAVPWHLQRMAPTKRSLVVMFSQAESQQADALSYATRGAEGRPIADFVVITPRVERPDPCIAMKKRFSGQPKDGQKK
jgi:uncharacterized iron-regulated protein